MIYENLKNERNIDFGSPKPYIKNFSKTEVESLKQKILKMAENRSGRPKPKMSEMTKNSNSEPNYQNTRTPK